MVPPVHRLSGKELQLVVIKAEAVEGEEPGERFRGQIVQGVVAKTKPLYIVQALDSRPVSDHWFSNISSRSKIFKKVLDT